MGKKIKMRSNSNLIRSHQKGATVAFFQPLLHKQYGQVFFIDISSNLHNLYIQRAIKAQKKIKKYDQYVLSTKVGTDRARNVIDSKFLEKAQLTTLDLVLFLYLAFEYLTINYLRPIYVRNKNSTSELENLNLDQRIDIIESISAIDIKKDEDYQGLVDFRHMRDNIMHPKPSVLYNPDDNDWDEVPLVWVMSGQYKEPYLNALRLFKKIERYHKETLSKLGPSTITATQRGLESEHQYKKSPN